MNVFNLTSYAIAGVWKGFVRWAAVIALSISVTACVGGINDLVPDQSKVAMSIAGVGHYGRKIGIPEFFVDGAWGGNASGWGGGGGGYCCVLLPRKIDKPVMVKVRWETYRSNVDEGRYHEQVVPIHFEVEPGKSSGLNVHFLPGHKVEVWVTQEWPPGPHYPGPKYPRGPAPDYAPLPDERPARAGEAGQ